MMRIFVICVGFLFAMATVSELSGAETPSRCADFLKQFGKKPAALEFVGCAHEESTEDDLWNADYRVSGSHAVAVEAFLAKNFRLKRLVKSCCQWDGPQAAYRNAGRTFGIAMQSEEEDPETVAVSRNEWHKAHFFHVRVTLHTEKEFPR